MAKPTRENTSEVKCIVAAHNANGEPDLFFVVVRCTEDQYHNGDHYAAANDFAEAQGYEPALAYDENDSAGRAMLGFFDWQTASSVSLA
ncbi:hypothetical protein [Geoalkalibacter halelectricus]|uniref:hypothetical protein n=1 Tax=Geoalkalibacter halelectricus TaxID=2847045 RepID=UPI00266F1C8A|nr:hypothetical protein [Geoalkalibacter halelectricus]MDO3380396.1 hypothetical protein [Geoalkalibacter halelectricus]